VSSKHDSNLNEQEQIHLVL